MKIILHLDLDAFYCQVEQVRLGLDPAIPLCVQQWSGLIAVNYAARAAGIKRHCTVDEAKRLCPEVVFVHVATYAGGDTVPKYHPHASIQTHKVSLDVYRNASRKIMEILKQECPTFQRASIDEAYLDLTAQVSSIISENEWPEQDHELGPLVVWGNAAYQAGEIQVTESRGLRELEFLVATRISQQIRDRVYNELGYTSSVGIASNKTLAKLISSLNKPNKQTILLDENVESFMKTIPLSKIRGLGGKLGDSVQQHFNVNLASDLWPYTEAQLVAKLGPEGSHIYKICRGVCDEQVKEVSNSKSMAACKSIHPPISNEVQGRKWIGILSAEIYSRVMDDYESFHRWPKTLVLHSSTKSKHGSIQTAFPSRKSTISPDIILQKAWTLFDDPSSYPCSRLSLTATQLELQVDLPSLDRWFSPSNSNSNSNDTVPAKETDKEERVNVECGECGQQVDIREYDEHLNHHFALKLHQEERDLRIQEMNLAKSSSKHTNSPKINVDKPTKKQKMTDFFKIK